ncbi:WG repeat-containing protein [Hwangdonia lutea]|uniref:WG repeat-containing protein n=1 Tax=Hwangdonia lutea TaxID=3075823 RepID=A0AA97ELN0_9FLAO|nr:WG repeat-containing protein [Hwangdonia sp. SCSIO 19198]WOD43706.1 WG repeat-containing protein [Hwangdonia sp. SCSIO 19198]
MDVDQLSAFNDGAAIVKKGMSTALIDPKGKFITQFNDYNFLGQYMAEGLQNGIFTVLNTNSKSAKRGFKGFINSTGKEISFQQNNYMQTSHLGNYLISRKNNMITFYDKTGKNFTINRYFNLYNETMYLKECVQNSSLFLFKDGKYGYKSSNDKIIIQPMWEEAKCFCDGAAMVGKKMNLAK